MTTCIFANGEIDLLEWIRPYLEQANMIIAADGGVEHLSRLGFEPDVLIGDLDSITADTRMSLSSEVTLLEHPVDKDETDLELALLYAAQNSAQKILVFGAFGGRLDQTIGNILLLAHPALDNRDIELIAQGQRAWLVSSETTIRGIPGDLVSLIPLNSDVQVEETTGLRWNLQGDTLMFGYARGISNELTSECATVTLQAGTLLCVHISQ
jgi:thiamine pyrophosphokinase